MATLMMLPGNMPFLPLRRMNSGYIWDSAQGMAGSAGDQAWDYIVAEAPSRAAPAMEMLMLFAALAGLIWGAVFLQRGGLLAGLMAALFAGMCLGLPFFKIVCGPIPLTIDRIALLLLVLQYALWRRWGLAAPKPMGRAERVLVLLMLYLAVSVFSHDFTANAWRSLSWLILYWAMPCAVYWIARNTAIGEKEIHAVWTCLAVFGGYLAVTMIAECFQQWWLIYPKYIVASAIDPEVEWVGRGRGPLLHPIGSGMLAAICLGASLLTWRRCNGWPKLAATPIILLLLACIYFSLTRSVWMGGAFAVALLAGSCIPDRWRWPALGLSMIVAAVVAVTCWESFLTYKRDRSLDAGMAKESAYLRPIFAAIASDMFRDRPLLGCGYGQYISEHVNYTANRSWNLDLEKARGIIQHNVMLSLLTETGLIGLGLFLALLGTWTRDAWRLWQTKTAPPWARQQSLLCLVAIAAYFINGLFHDMTVVAMANMTLFFLAGVTASLRAHASFLLPRAREGGDVPVAG